MQNDPDDDRIGDDDAADVDENEASYVAAYDLDGDGKVSPVEDARATLGLLDARLEEAADEGGVKGAIADAAHHIVDRLDND